MDTFIELLRLGAVGIIAGIFSAYMVIRRHRNMKWWELRVASYQAVIEALSDLKYYFDQNYQADIEYRELTDVYKAELEKFWDESYHKVRRATDNGVFLFSDDVNTALEEFISLKNEHYNTRFEYLDSNLAVAERCLRTVVESAKKDLRLQDTWV